MVWLCALTAKLKRIGTERCRSIGYSQHASLCKIGQCGLVIYSLTTTSIFDENDRDCITLGSSQLALSPKIGLHDSIWWIHFWSSDRGLNVSG